MFKSDIFFYRFIIIIFKSIYLIRFTLSKQDVIAMMRYKAKYHTFW